MLKIPMGFKGPKGQINKRFSPAQIYQAMQLLLNDGLTSWQHKEQVETIQATVTDNSNKHRVSIGWPIGYLGDNETDEFDTIGSCNCAQEKPCVHLAALMIESKSRLDQLPPFTQQLQASHDIAQTFSQWMSKQVHDPYPNMARHRVAYILDFNQQTQKFEIALHKAYISTEDRYSIKAPLHTDLLSKTPLPKFVTLADQKIFHLLNKSLIGKHHHFVLKEDRDQEVLREIIMTGRCFWKALYRTPIEFNEGINLVSPSAKKLINHFYFSVAENTIMSTTEANDYPITINPNQKLTPHLHLNSHEVTVDVGDQYDFDFDVAYISFISGNHEFTFADLSSARIVPNSQILSQMAAYLRQIENLDSVYAHFEKTVLQSFHLNDRFVDADLGQHALLLRGLQLDGWKITIDDNFRYNRQQVNDWYANIVKDEVKDDWFDLELGIKVSGQEVNILPYLVKAINSGKWQHNNDQNLNLKLDDGSNISLAQDTIKQILSTLTELYDDKSLSSNQQLKLSTTQLIRVNQLQSALSKKHDAHEALHGTLQIKGDQWLREKAKQLAGNTTLEIVKQPKNIQVKLRDYQQLGLSWLQFLSQHQLGGILADDMGLGKTLQVLAHILMEKNNDRLSNPCLIVVPTTLLSNWQTEIQKYTPNLKSLVLMGSKRHKLYEQVKHYDIIITSYGIMSRDTKHLTALQWHFLILDEAQTIKNARTQVAKTASSLSAYNRICLTGTPIENHLGELWSLFNFLMPGFLGTNKQFEKIYQTPIERFNDEERQADLSQRISPFMLRRTKAEVAKELPDKTEIVQIIELNEAQANLYETIRLTMSDEIKQALQKSQGTENKIIIGNALLRLRQVCCHPSLLKLTSIDDKQESAKLNWLKTMLPNMIEQGQKILLFSSFTSMLDIIQENLQTLKIDSIKLTGQTPANKRGQLIDQFQNGKIPVFLISLKAGGAGINLTTADTVIHYDPWWNPAAEAQASDRAHRIGQDKNVFVYKLITKGTVEQKIHHLQKHKHDLAQGIFDKQAKISSILDEGQWQDFLKPIE